MFRTVPLSISRSFSLYTQQCICHTGLLTACEQDQDGTPDDGQRNCPKHVEFYSKNKFEKLVHLVGFIIRIYHDAPSPERQIFQLFILFLCLFFCLVFFYSFIFFYLFIIQVYLCADSAVVLEISPCSCNTERTFCICLIVLLYYCCYSTLTDFLQPSNNKKFYDSNSLRIFIYWLFFRLNVLSVPSVTLQQIGWGCGSVLVLFGPNQFGVHCRSQSVAKLVSRL